MSRPIHVQKHACKQSAAPRRAGRKTHVRVLSRSSSKLWARLQQVAFKSRTSRTLAHFPFPPFFPRAFSPCAVSLSLTLSLHFWRSSCTKRNLLVIALPTLIRAIQPRMRLRFLSRPCHSRLPGILMPFPRLIIGVGAK